MNNTLVHAGSDEAMKQHAVTENKIIRLISAKTFSNKKMHKTKIQCVLTSTFTQRKTHKHRLDN